MSNDIQEMVQSKYASVAKSGLSTGQSGVRAVAEAFGYTSEQLASIPAEANMGLSCGNPTAFASLKPGETVVDLGCGGGLDVFLAAKRLGPTGKAIGIDMTPEMLDLARRNAATADNPKKTTILFLCTGNSCRSQMAEGWARKLKGEFIEAYSAGIETHGLNPDAVRVMAEAGVDISGQRSKHVSELRDVEFDHVVTVCGHAHDHCPVFPGKARITHVGFDDPPRLAAGATTEEQRLAPYRRVRDEIREFTLGLPESLQE